jgi:hypothetical protein
LESFIELETVSLRSLRHAWARSPVWERIMTPLTLKFLFTSSAAPRQGWLISAQLRRRCTNLLSRPSVMHFQQPSGPLSLSRRGFRRQALHRGLVNKQRTKFTIHR